MGKLSLRLARPRRIQLCLQHGVQPRDTERTAAHRREQLYALCLRSDIGRQFFGEQAQHGLNDTLHGILANKEEVLAALSEVDRLLVHHLVRIHHNVGLGRLAVNLRELHDRQAAGID